MDLLTAADLAAMLKMSRGHIFRLVHERRIPFLRIGHAVRFDPSVIGLWLKRQQIRCVDDVLQARRAVPTVNIQKEKES